MRIDKLNKEIKECRKCRLSESRMNSICGEGKLNAKLMLIAQAPGKEEDKEGKMFVGPSGKVLNELLVSVGINRQEIYMTNLVKCMLPKYRRPKENEIDTCSHYLNREIELINPKVLVPLGYYATRHILKKYDVLSSLNIKFSQVYGKLFLAGDKKILPLPHPAVILYNPGLKQDILKNYRKLKVLIKDCKWYPLCPMKRFYEAGILDRKWIELYCKGDWERCTRYKMEEEGKPHSDCMLPDGTIDEKLYRL